MYRDNDTLYDLTDTGSPPATLAEIKNILLMLEPSPDPSPIENIYEDIIRLFIGEFPGYRASNTKYHNLEHTSSTTLAAARLIHGLHVQGQVFSPRLVQLCLIGALFHDTGLIQTEDEVEGTGARHTIGHEKRSIALMEKYLTEKGFSPEDIRDCSHIIMSTELTLSLAEIPFNSEEVRTMGKVLGSADLIAQMADSNYQENLPLLFMEFEEAGIEGFKSPLELFKKTEEFYRSVARKRLTAELEGVSSAALYHFRERWKIDKDLYDESIKYNIRRLKESVMVSLAQLSIISR
ncbi:MAG: HD domain-containing protein [Deltaproteobacteria bacterium]|jgi:HD superfamily phosphodiesterase|nr:HD domain-containing protein [Deltaproteobacteria bacterium]